MDVRSVPTPVTLDELLQKHASKQPDSIFLQAPNRSSLSYANADEQCRKAARILRAFGIQTNDRVALVMPTSPEATLAFLALGMVATCAPMNPTYKYAEVDFFFTDLRVKALFTFAGYDTIARQLATKRNIPVIEIRPILTEPAGMFEFIQLPASISNNITYAQLEDVAIVLHTSGTTSRPKTVPLTHTNICLAGYHTAQSLNLTPTDRSLNVLPLFHVHGLIIVIVTTLVSGGSIVCTQGFDAHSFLEHLRNFKPTWFTAGPTVHQALLEHLSHESELPRNHSLRFIRSASSSLHPATFHALEKAFGVPVIDSYGLSEASHILSNPLPPAIRKAGSVGISTGTEIAIVDENDTFLGCHQVGEIVARGKNITKGYADNPAANAVAFTTEGWFHTGDQGYFDEDGYFYITGRIKELINRAGEKVSPLELDDLLTTHEAIAEAAAFSIPHPLLGEDTAVAIVCKPDKQLTASAVKAFIAQHLAYYKIPSRVIFVSSILKGPTGKVQRRLLPVQVGLVDTEGNVIPPSPEEMQEDENYVEPKTQLEISIIKSWKKVLPHPRIGVHDHFFLIGGNSMMAIQLVAEIERQTGYRLPPAVLFSHPTITDLIRLIFEESLQTAWQCLIPVRSTGTKSPLYCTHPNSGGIEYVFRLAEYLDADQPVYGLQAVGLNGDEPPLTSNKAMASLFVEKILEIQPDGVYNLAGYSSGGSVAYEMAQILSQQGHHVNQLFMFDTYPPAQFPFNSRVQFPYILKNIWLFLTTPLDKTYYLTESKWQVIGKELGSIAHHVWNKISYKLKKYLPSKPSLATQPLSSNERFLQIQENIVNACYIAHYNYTMYPYTGSLVLVRSLNNEVRKLKDTDLGWKNLVNGRVSVYDLPTDHFDVFLHDSTCQMAAKIVQKHLNDSENTEQLLSKKFSNWQSIFREKASKEYSEEKI